MGARAPIATSLFPFLQNSLLGCSERRRIKTKTQRRWDFFLLKNVNSSPIGASGGVRRQRVSPVAVFLLKHFPVPTNHEGLFSCPQSWAWPMTFPPTSGISPTEELLCETHCFLTSRHLSLLLTYIHPAINCFGTSVAPSIHEKNQNVDQKLIFFSPKITCWQWYLSEAHQWEAGEHMASLTMVPSWENRYHEVIWWGAVLGSFWGFIEYFLLLFLTSIFF